MECYSFYFELQDSLFLCVKINFNEHRNRQWFVEFVPFVSPVVVGIFFFFFVFSCEHVSVFHFIIKSMSVADSMKGDIIL